MNKLISFCLVTVSNKIWPHDTFFTGHVLVFNKTSKKQPSAITPSTNFTAMELPVPTNGLHRGTMGFMDGGLELLEMMAFVYSMVRSPAAMKGCKSELQEVAPKLRAPSLAPPHPFPIQVGLPAKITPSRVAPFLCVRIQEFAALLERDRGRQSDIVTLLSFSNFLQ